MKQIRVFAAMILLSQPLMAQLFIRVMDGDLVNSFADSRSVNFVDVNDDGWEDVFISNGSNPGVVNLLYMNNGDGSFTPVTEDSIVSHEGSFDGATFADADNDGDLDVFVVTWYGQKNRYYTSNGDGSFGYDSESELNGGFSYSETASWGDYDADGFVDVYVSNSGGDKRNFLFRNLGNGQFEKIIPGVQSTDNKPSRSVNWVDFDMDGDLDLFVTNESEQPNDMYVNDGAGGFTKLSDDPLVEAISSSMSSSWADIDNDLDLDVFIANSMYFEEQSNQLFINNGDGSFTESDGGELASDGGCSYGSNFADYDNDGDLDLVVMNGYCSGEIENYLYVNDGEGNFTRDMTSIADLSTPCSYGGAWGDIDNNGFPDLIIATCNDGSGGGDPVNLMYQNTGTGNNWLKVRLLGDVSNASCIGAKILVKAVIDGQAIWQMREISAQSGYCGQNSLIAHFGLGDAVVCDSVIVQFPSGKDSLFLNVPVNEQVDIFEWSVVNIPETDHPTVALHAYPNPVTDKLVVEIPAFAEDAFQIRITDILQRQVYQADYRGLSSSLVLDVKAMQLTAGYYTLHLLTEQGRGLLPFVLK